MENIKKKSNYRIISQQRKNEITIQEVGHNMFIDIKAEDILADKELLAAFNESDQGILHYIQENSILVVKAQWGNPCKQD